MDKWLKRTIPVTSKTASLDQCKSQNNHETTDRSANNDSAIEDLGVDLPKQVHLNKYPVKDYGSQKRSFSSNWYKNRPWLEYLVKRDAVFCFPCRKFKSTATDTIFTIKGFDNWNKF